MSRFATCTANGETFYGVVSNSGVLNDPVTSILWLARRMAEYGQAIEPGDIVPAGSFIRPPETPTGTKIDVDFDPFGAVQINFA